MKPIIKRFVNKMHDFDDEKDRELILIEFAKEIFEELESLFPKNIKISPYWDRIQELKAKFLK